MAKKIFRLHEGGSTEQTGWFKSGIITSEHLKTIRTAGKDVATSIPTPFATIDLVKSAFRWVTDNTIHGSTAHHKLVSDALDVAQLFFSTTKFSNKIRIAAWNPTDRLQDIQENGNKAHKKYASTLELFWNQDSVQEDQLGQEVLYNFEKTRRLYFVLNKETNHVIGGTSPATLFFASPDVRNVTKNLAIKIGQDILFDDSYAALANREVSFVKYLYTLAKQPGFAFYFPEVYDYLEATKEHLGATLKRAITDIEAEDLQTYNPCTVLENPNDVCEILGFPLKIQPVDTHNITLDSDFVAQTDFIDPNEAPPLVLPQFPFSKSWTYTTKGIIWDEKTHIPYKNPATSNASKLPIQNDPYYWLTIGNFFEETLIALPYPIDASKFVTCGSKNHLLPLTETFFKYFKAEKASQYLSLQERSGGNVEATLKIPVKGGEISFKKHYSAADNNMVELEVHMAIFPFLKSDDFELTHTIGLLDDRLEKPKALKLSAFKEGVLQSFEDPITRNPGEGGGIISTYYKVENQPDVFGITAEKAKGFAIPIFRPAGGTTQVNFAIDFGTTNTHIEYQYGNNESTSLDNAKASSLWNSLMSDKGAIDPIYPENEKIFEQEILPFVSLKGQGLSFPLRTALVSNKDTNFKNNPDLIREVNNYLLLERRSVPNYLNLDTELKWSNYANSDNEKKVELYLEFVTSIALYKTLQLGGSPANATITWFYPVSMDEAALGVFFKLWKQVYQRVFKLDPTKEMKGIKGIPESIAPYLHYKATVEGLSLSIDIGGGSSDIAVFDEDDQKAKLIASFKFAGNAIFGDGYPSKEFQNSSDRNGFVKAFRNAAKEAVGDYQEKGSILGSILERKNSADFSSYLFALEQEGSSGFSYTRLLQKNQKIKLSILVFYGAIAYYSAHLLKKGKIGIPNYVLLSGTASKSVAIVDSSEELYGFSGLFQHIFESVYKKSAEEKLEIKLSSMPKEITCKGALRAGTEDSIKKSPIKFWIGGTQEDAWGSLLDREEDVERTPTYRELDESLKAQIEESIEGFYTILDTYMNTIRIQAKYGIDPNAYAIFKEVRSRGIKELLTRGIKAYDKKPNAKIEESLFFYPLIGILNKLSYALAEQKN